MVMISFNRNPPHNEKAEACVLGSVLLDPYGVIFLCQKQNVSAESFYLPAHRVVWEAIEILSRTPKSVFDEMTIEDQIKRAGKLDGIGGHRFIASLIDATPTSAHAEHYIALIRESELRRKAITVIREAEHLLHDVTKSEAETVAKLETELTALRVNSGLEITRLSDYKKDKIEQWRSAKGKGYVGIPTSLPQVNRYLGGWRRQVMSILGGYRGCGKSTLSRQECLWLAQQGYKVALFSLEDPGDIAAASIVGNFANTSTFALDTGSYHDPLEIDMIATKWDVLKDLPLWIVATSMTCDQIIATANLLKRQHGLDILFIDHIQLIKPYELPKSNRNNTIAVYSQSIVGLAKSLDIPIVCLSQLSRAPEQGDRKPRLSDLRDSGTIEQDARQVLLLYRQDNHFKLEIAKNNFGVSGKDVTLNRIDGKQRFEEELPATQSKPATSQEEDGISEE